MGGFELLDLHDFPGQGTALVGVLDPFWDDKGYVTAGEYRRFCDSTVPLARLGGRVFTTGESLAADIEVAHFGPAPIRGAAALWKLAAGSRVIAEGKLPLRDIPIDNGISLGKIGVDLGNVEAPAHCKLTVSVAGFENDWDVWVYPKAGDGPAGASPYQGNSLVTSSLDETARERLRAGGKVLLTIPGGDVCNYGNDPVELGFSSIFWNTAWTRRQAPTTLGILCDPKHPALAEFPTDFHSDCQWWYLIHRAGALRLDLLPPGVTPIVRVIDDWVTARPLGLIVEGKVGSGKIIICGFDLTQGADDPVSRQMRRSLEDYMAGDKFHPAMELTAGEIESLISPLPPPKGLRGVRLIKADSEEENYGAANAIDGAPETMWHTSWEGNPPGFPHWLMIQLDGPRKIAGFTALPRQDGERNGWIKDYAFYASRDGTNWGEAVAQGVFPDNARRKTVKFAAPVEAQFVKLVALSGYANGPWASLAEINLIEGGQEK
jgi:hypothetical protein